jgi:hypothetical protein
MLNPQSTNKYCNNKLLRTLIEKATDMTELVVEAMKNPSI